MSHSLPAILLIVAEISLFGNIDNSPLTFSKIHQNVTVAMQDVITRQECIVSLIMEVENMQSVTGNTLINDKLFLNKVQWLMGI